MKRVCVCRCRDAEFCTEGVQYFACLVEKSHFIPAVHCLYYITPLFHTSPSYLTASNQYVTLCDLINTWSFTQMKLGDLIIHTFR